jgi:hypothetical protein
MRNPGELIFTLEPGMNESEINTLVQNCVMSRNALDEFLSDDIDEDELCAILEDCTVNVDEFSATVNHNLNWLGLC